MNWDYKLQYYLYQLEKWWWYKRTEVYFRWYKLRRRVSEAISRLTYWL